MDIKSVLESILFAHGAPITLKKLSKITGVGEKDTRDALHELKEEYKTRGFIILEKDEEYQLGSNPIFAKYIESMVKDEFMEELTRAALETIAIIAYRGPLTRAQIEFVRGVNSSFTVRNLLMRGLVERVENPKDARSYLYRISFDFLKHLGLTEIKDLPNYQEFRKEYIEAPEETKDSLANVHGSGK